MSGLKLTDGRRHKFRIINAGGVIDRLGNDPGKKPNLLLVSCPDAFRDARAKRRAVQWLADNSLIDDDDADRFLVGRPDPDLP